MKCIQTQTSTCSLGEWKTFEQEHSWVQTRTFTLSNELFQTFEWGPSCVRARTFTHSNEEPQAFERGSSHIRMRPGSVCFACGMRLYYTLCLMGTVCDAIFCRNFNTKVCVRNLQDFILYDIWCKKLARFSSCLIPSARNCKLFTLQDDKCKKYARFWSCKIGIARNKHIFQKMCKMVQDFLFGYFLYFFQVHP